MKPLETEHRNKRAKFTKLAVLNLATLVIASSMYYCGNRTRYCGEEDNMWQLHNANYHQMVSILTQVVRSMSPLRIEAPELHPKVVDGDMEEDN